MKHIADPATFHEPGAIIVRVPSGVRSKEKLLGIIAQQLNFPRYFGWNWDAFEECLRDLSWYTEPRKIILVHHAWPFGSASHNREVYRSILADLASQPHASGHTIEVVVPETKSG
ncbi:MAG: barstar family protein [Planctomycetaceae bacterium]|nr:barstar family protein [Planctomycetaceae bacterium]